MNYHKRNRWLKQHGFLTYSQYLITQHWQDLRQRLFNVRGKKCERCDSEKEIEIHHKTYERIGKEELSDLLILCRTCHGEEHAKLKLERMKRRVRRFAICCNLPLIIKWVSKTQPRRVCPRCGQRDHRLRRKIRMTS